MAEINDLSVTDGSNTARFPENMVLNAVNDGARALEGIIARGLKDTVDGIITTGGSSTAYTAAANRTLSAYYDGLQLTVEFHTASGATPTLNVDSVGAQSLVWPDGTAVGATEIPANLFAKVIYDETNTNWVVLTTTGLELTSSDIGSTVQAEVITTRGDIIRGDSSGDAERLAIGAAGTALCSDGTDAAWDGVIKQGVHTVFIPAGAMRPTVSNGCAALEDAETTAGRPDITFLAFDASSDEHAQFQFAPPKSWNGGVVQYQVYWTSDATDTDGVTWALQGAAVSDGDTMDVVYGTAITVDDACQSTAEDLYISPVSGDVTIAGTPADADMVFFRIFRDVSDANDTAAEDAKLVGVRLLLTLNAADDS